MIRPAQLAALLAMTLLVNSAALARPLTLYVSPSGNDAWAGTHDRGRGTTGPLATLEGARDAIRKLKAKGPLPAGGVTVEIGAGTYSLTGALSLGQEDSGTEVAPIVYRAQPGAAVRLVGGKTLNAWTVTTDAAILKRLPEVAHGKVMQTDLKAEGITDFGNLSRRGFGRPVVASHLELFFQDMPMTLARWPNGAYAKITGVLPGDYPGFTLTGGNSAHWADEPDPWVYGYWYFDWADEYIPLQKIDSATNTIHLPLPKPMFDMRAGQRFFVLNLLSELDQPGEWYLNRATGILYFWPPAPLEGGRAAVSLTPTLLQMNNASYVTFRGMTLEDTRGTAVTINGGSNDSIIGCTIRNTGNQGVDISGGDHHGVVGCDIYETSDGGISLSGGDRKTLTPCGHRADNNNIYNYSRWDHTYRPAIGVAGDGVQVTHNWLHDGQHDAIQLGGNDHLIEFNEINHVAYDTNDVGAFYTGRDWTARGTILRYNFFHDIGDANSVFAMGIYLDDQASGFTVFGNLFHNVTRAIFIGGGVDNTVDNNLFVDCTPAVHLDDRGLNWQKKATLDPNDTLQSNLRAMPVGDAPWKDRFPTLVHILEDDPGTPKRNSFVHNIAVGGKWSDISPNILQFQTLKDNLPDADRTLLQPLGNRFCLRPGTPANTIAFAPIPVEKMGLYESKDRASKVVRGAAVGGR